jgi:Ca2+-transporting ATPase
LSCRSEKHTAFDSVRPPSNPYLNAAIVGALFIQVLTMFLPPLRRFLGVVPPGLSDLAVIGTTAIMPLLINEGVKKRENDTP